MTEIKVKENGIEIVDNQMNIYLTNGDMFSIEIDTNDVFKKLQELGLVPNTKEEADIDMGFIPTTGEF